MRDLAVFLSYRRADIEGLLGRRALADLPYDPRVDESIDSGAAKRVLDTWAKTTQTLV